MVLAAFEHDVEIWDLVTHRMVSAFATGFDFGGRRLALSDTADLLFAGAYYRTGLAAHDTNTGEIRWIRRELRKVQLMSMSADGRRLFCGREGFPCEVLCAATGVTLERIKGARTVVESPWEPISLRNQRRPFVQDTSGRKRFHIVGKASAAMLDAVFAPGRLVISEIAGPVRCVSTADGSESWRYTPGEGHHVLSLAYRPSDDHVVGLEWPFMDGGSSTMLSWHGASGVCTSRINLGADVSHAHGFCQSGDSIVTASRQVLSTVDGKLRSELV